MKNILLMTASAMALNASAFAAATKISEMPSGGSLQAGDIVPVVRGGANYKATFPAPGGELITATGTSTPVAIQDRFAYQAWAQDYGAKCDGIELTDVVTASGGTGISSVKHPFLPWDAGKFVDIFNPNDGAVVATGTIVGVNPATHVATLSVPASSTQTAGRMVMYLTDDTAAINAADLALSQSGGGSLRIPGGYCAHAGLTHNRQVIYEGEGRGISNLYLIRGANKGAVKSEGFDALQGTGLNYGPDGTFNGAQSDHRVPSFFGMRNLTVDGNYQNQSGTSDCFDGYGNGQVIEHVEIRNCRNRGMWTQASPAYAYSSADWRAQEEGWFFDIIVRNTGDDGWTDDGPHDQLQDYYVAYDWGHNGSGWGFRNRYSAGIYSGSGHYGHIHPYTSNGTKNSIYIGSGGDYRFLYSDFGNTIIAPAPNSGGVSVDSALLLACGAGGVSPCLGVQSANVSLAHITGQWQSSTPGTNLVMVQVAAGAEGTFIGDFNGSAVPSQSASNKLLKVESNFNDITVSAHNMTGTSNVCADIGGTFNTVHFTSYGCKTHVAYTPGDSNTVWMNSYVNGGETLLTGTPNAHDRFFITSPSINSNLLPSLTVNGDMTVKYRAVSASGTLTATDHTVGVNTSGGAYTETLPTPSAGRLLTVCDVGGNADANNITLDAGTGITISGPSGVAQTRTIGTNRQCLNLEGTSTSNWIEK